MMCPILRYFCNLLQLQSSSEMIQETFTLLFLSFLSFYPFLSKGSLSQYFRLLQFEFEHANAIIILKSQIFLFLSTPPKGPSIKDVGPFQGGRGVSNYDILRYQGGRGQKKYDVEFFLHQINRQNPKNHKKCPQIFFTMPQRQCHLQARCVRQFHTTFATKSFIIESRQVSFSMNTLYLDD